VCFFAREDAVGASYPGNWADDAGGANDGLGSMAGTWEWFTSINDDSEALRVNRLCEEGGEAGLRTEWDFWPRKLPDFAARKELLLVAGAESNA
jgi:hypothetical protein